MLSGMTIHRFQKREIEKVRDDAAEDESLTRLGERKVYSQLTI
jgi:hypothetical protein